MRKLVADITFRGLAIANAPGLFARLHQFDWYGGTLRGMIEWRNLPNGADVLEIGCGPGGLTRDLANMGSCGVGLYLCISWCVSLYPSCRIAASIKVSHHRPA